jgi:hypothetical protein
VNPLSPDSLQLTAQTTAPRGQSRFKTLKRHLKPKELDNTLFALVPNKVGQPVQKADVSKAAASDMNKLPHPPGHWKLERFRNGSHKSSQCLFVNGS